MKYFEKMELLQKERPIEIGDTIVAMGEKATIAEIYYLDRYVEEKDGKYDIFYDVEFRDTNGKLRHWKSYFDGGYVKFNNGGVNMKEILNKMSDLLEKLEKHGKCLKALEEELESRLKNIVILQEGRYALIDRGHEYVVACGFNGNEWNQGYYYSHWNNEKQKAISLAEAVDHFRLLTDETYISRGRIEELATHFKDGLLCDDEESAMEYFERVCDMDEKEMQFFEIEKEEE